MAAGAARKMKQVFGQNLNLNFCITDAETARKYRFKGSTNVMFNDELIPFHIAINERSLKELLSKKWPFEK